MMRVMAKKHKPAKSQDRRDRKVSIVVLVMNKLEFTRVCFDALFANTQRFELVIVDNGSADATKTYLERVAAEHENVTLLRSETNLGFAGGCNAGVAAAKHSLICLLNNDTIVQPGWLDAMRDALRPGAGIVGAKLLFPNGLIQHCGIVFRPDMYPYHRHHSEDPSTADCDRLQKVPAATAACLLTSKKVWDEVGGMDEVYVRGNFEDVDFNLKVRELGYDVIYQPGACVYHFTGRTNSDDPQAAGQALDRNRALYLTRWGHRQDLATV